jgi:hypothetical protein
MTALSDLPLTTNLDDLRKAARDIEKAVRMAGEQLEADLAAKAEAKKQRSSIDELEEKIMATTAVAAAASGTPEQAREMLSKARAKAMQAAADGADTGTLDAMVHQMEHLTKIAEEKREVKSDRRDRGWMVDDGGAGAIPYIVAIAADGWNS